MDQCRPLFYFRSFQTSITIFTTDICEKCPSSIQYQDSNSRPSEPESPLIATRPGLPPSHLTLLINPNETGWSRFANDLPAGVRDACVVTLDEKSLMLIGGDTKMQNFSTSTFKFGSSFNWETSEPLNIGRRSAGCGIIRFVKSYPMKRGL